MAKDVFDTPPQGMIRTKKGRIRPVRNAVMSNLKKENIELKDRLAALEELVTGLATKKGKK